MEYNPIQTNAMPIKDKIKNLFWTYINMTLFRFTPSHFKIFRKFRVGLLKMFGAKLDWTVSIHPTAKIDYPWNLSMGNKSSLGENSWVYAMDSISIGEKTCIGKEVYLLTGSHNISSLTFDLVTKPIAIGDNIWIATGAMIMPGIIVNDFSVVAAGSVVIKNVECQSIVGGNPARFIKNRFLIDK